jgi:hypothetical protein
VHPFVHDQVKKKDEAEKDGDVESGEDDEGKVAEENAEGINGVVEHYQGNRKHHDVVVFEGAVLDRGGGVEAEVEGPENEGEKKEERADGDEKDRKTGVGGRNVKKSFGEKVFEGWEHFEVDDKAIVGVSQVGENKEQIVVANHVRLVAEDVDGGVLADGEGGAGGSPNFIACVVGGNDKYGVVHGKVDR